MCGSGNRQLCRRMNIGRGGHSGGDEARSDGRTPAVSPIVAGEQAGRLSGGSRVATAQVHQRRFALHALVSLRMPLHHSFPCSVPAPSAWPAVTASHCSRSDGPAASPVSAQL